MKKKFDTLFLDRDGVINYKIENDYVKSIQDFKFIPEFIYVVKDLSLLFNRIIIITNQQGIGKGLMSISDLNEIHEYMLNTINDNNGKIDKIYFCPHHPAKGFPNENKKYKVICSCRKPKPGMYLEIANELNISLSETIVVGDSLRDLEAAQKVGAQSILVLTGKGEKTYQYSYNRSPKCRKIYACKRHYKKEKICYWSRSRINKRQQFCFF